MCLCLCAVYLLTLSLSLSLFPSVVCACVCVQAHEFSEELDKTWAVLKATGQQKQQECLDTLKTLEGLGITSNPYSQLAPQDLANALTDVENAGESCWPLSFWTVFIHFLPFLFR